MEKYREYQPTWFDRKGAFLDDDRQDWFVLPVIRTRDSGPLEESNFSTALDIVGGEGDNVEVHRFGHWGPGWFEIIIINPILEQLGQKIEDSLENYPVLDDDDYSEREWDYATESWNSLTIGERVELCKKYRCNIFKARHDYLPDDDSGGLYQHLSE